MREDFGDLGEELQGAVGVRRAAGGMRAVRLLCVCVCVCVRVCVCVS